MDFGNKTRENRKSSGLGLILRKSLTSSWGTLCGQAARLPSPAIPIFKKYQQAEN